MSFGGLVSSSSANNGGGGETLCKAMSGGAAIARPPPPSLLPPPVSKTSAFSLAFKGKMDGHGDMGMLGEQFDPSALLGRMKDDGYESRSGSDNLEGISGDDQDAAVTDQRPRKKKYHRHTQDQIKELESFFHECPHPDEKQRLELSRRLGLETKQIKFWFQNRRTQMKTQLERHENIILRQENDKLRAENEMLKHNMADPICNNCGGSVMPGPVSLEQQQLRIENARLKDELGRVCALANKFLGRPLSSSATPVPPPFSPNFKLDLAVGRHVYGELSNVETTLPMGLDYNDGVVTPLAKPMNNSNEVNYDRSMFIDLAMTAMDELIKMAQCDSTLWIKTLNGGKEILNLEEYMRTSSPCIGMKPSSFVTEATRETGIVISSSLALVEALMDANRCMEMFLGLIAVASTIEVLSSGMSGTKNGALQVMHAEFQVVSPLVPVRQVKFLRFCKQHADGVWAVVDVSVDVNQENPHTYPSCRRLPSGCIVQDMPNGCCKVTWVEHSEYDESAVHHLYRPVLSSGRGFGAQRWIATLQRYWECMAILMSSPISNEDLTAISLEGRKSMIKLAHRMVDSFCNGICASSTRRWDKLLVGNVAEDVRILTRKSINVAGEPSGIVLSAATSVWLPASRQRLFDFLRDERSRSEWDILSHGGLIQEMVHIAKGQGRGNHISLLRSSAMNGNVNDNGMMILQDTWNDASTSMLVYAPVDITSMSVVMNGDDSSYVSLLPSGFVILPDDAFNHFGPNGYEAMMKRDGDGEGSGSLLTFGIQILVNHLPTAKLTVESVDTVNNLMALTVSKIKDALQLT